MVESKQDKKSDTLNAAKEKIIKSAALSVSDLKKVSVAESMTSKLGKVGKDALQDWVGEDDIPDERTFWNKISGSTKRIGRELAITGIKSYLAMIDPKTSTKNKAILGAALAYFVLPADMIPDFLAGVGFTDDIAAMTFAMNSVGDSITDEHQREAEKKWNGL